MNLKKEFPVWGEPRLREHIHTHYPEPVSLIGYNLRYFGLESNKVQALDNPFDLKILGI